MTDVLLGSAVTALAVSSGVHCVPQPSNRCASLHRRDTHAQWFRSSSIMPAQAQKTYAFTPNAPSRGLERPSNIMSGIMRSRQSVTSANDASHTLPSSHNLHYIKWPQPPRCGFIALAKPSGSLCSPQPPRGLIGVRKRTSSLWHPPSPSLRTVCAAFPAQQPAVVFRGSVRIRGQIRCYAVRLAQQCRGLFGLVGGCQRKRKKSMGFAESVKPVSDRVCQRAQRVKAKSRKRDAGAALTRLRALAVVNH